MVIFRIKIIILVFAYSYLFIHDFLVISLLFNLWCSISKLLLRRRNIIIMLVLVMLVAVAMKFSLAMIRIFTVFALAERSTFYTSLETLTVFLDAMRLFAVASFSMLCNVIFYLLDLLVEGIWISINNFSHFFLSFCLIIVIVMTATAVTKFSAFSSSSKAFAI